MKFATLIALVGATSAAKLGCAPQCEQVIDCGCDAGYGRARGGAAARLSGSSANSQGYAKLCSESAQSNTQIGGIQYTIPDKNTVTDQAKVSEAISSGNTSEKNCQVAKRNFTISGDICVEEKYTNQLKGEDSSSKCGQGSSQTKSRTSVANNCCGSASVPLTTGLAGGCSGLKSCECRKCSIC